jgi:hypothetical protein
VKSGGKFSGVMIIEPADLGKPRGNGVFGVRAGDPQMTLHGFLSTQNYHVAGDF